MRLQELISIIRISQQQGFFFCIVKKINLSIKILKLLSKNNLINGYTIFNKYILIFLRYNYNGLGVLKNINSCSTPGNLIYKKKNYLIKYMKYTSNGCLIFSSTNKKFIFLKKSPIKSGGEIIFKF